MADRLHGKVAIVSGAARGLGEADARRFAAEGACAIVNMTSVASLQGEPDVAGYCAQQKNGIRCNSIHPSAIKTAMAETVGAPVQKDPAVPAILDAQQSLQNVPGEPNDVACLVLYLASEESKFVNGQRFVVDNAASVIAGFVP